jgi:hypothetical protein
MKITYEGSDPDAWVCICGNTPCDDGFQTCDKQGNDLEPTKESGWNGLYYCVRCNRVIDQDTLEVIKEPTI